MRRASMRAIVSASTALVATAALMDAGCSTQATAPADAPTASALKPVMISGDTKGAKLPVSAEDVQALQAPVVAAATEGDYTAWGTVVDAGAGKVLLGAAAAAPHMLTLTTKTLATLSVLHHLGPTVTLMTSVPLGADDQTLHLDPEGDLLPGTGTSDEVEISGCMGLQALMRSTAAVLVQRGITSVTLSWRGSLFEGASHPSSRDVQGIGSYEDHIGPMMTDTECTYEGVNASYSDAPRRVAKVFSQALSTGRTPVTLGKAGDPPAGAEVVAQVSSTTTGGQLRWTLVHSDNTPADQYCRFAVHAAGAPSTCDGATETVRKTLTEAGVSTKGLTLKNCSSLPSDDKIGAHTLVGVLRVSYEGTGTEANTMRLLPWAGLVDTFSKRMTEEFTAGNVQAKTGTLRGVTFLSGSVMMKSGRVLFVSIDHDNVAENAYATCGYLDAFEKGLAGLD